ncbi:MAG: ATP-dependent DNA helicase RecG [Phycisphaerales bacterium]|nr:ATP-dependent DNA helicase RecG [Phycisphaerales bacterium]
MQNTTNELRRSVQSLDGFMPEHLLGLEKLGIKTVADLIKHIPYRFEAHHGSTTIQESIEILGDAPRSTDLVSITGEIVSVRPIRGWKKSKARVEVVLEDDSGELTVHWFNQPWIAKKLHPEMRIRVHGTLSNYKNKVQMTNPRWEEVESVETAQIIDGGLCPVYRANEYISSTAISTMVDEILTAALPLIEDHFPNETCSSLEMPKLQDAYRMVHKPKDLDESNEGRRRIAYDELFLLQLGVMMKRHHRQATMHALALSWNENIRSRIESRIPFTLTPSQQHVIEEIANDVTRTIPMNRLLQGDVGSGKTVVAVHAMLMAVVEGSQAALMAPTELLAEQHFKTIQEMLDGSSVSVALLTSSLSTKERNACIQKIGNGTIDIVVGTHALLTSDVVFSNIAVSIVDEQHRFGVHQRATLRNKRDDAKTVPHTLVMTATPIPRTLSLTIFGDLDVSTITGLPLGRSPITTRLVCPQDAPKVYTYLRELVDQGQQGYVVVPLVEDTDSGMKAVTSHAASLRETYFKEKHIACIHGRMKSEEREETMQSFRAGAIDVLVATTVIEVGVDVPNATMIVIEHADRFGLAQLHQLRGRVGRGELKGVCALIASPTTPDATERLQAIVESTDGFLIAEKDLEIRGPGELFGSKQSGIPPFTTARLPRDLELLRMARREAIKWIEQDPTLANSELLRKRLLKKYGESLGLGDVA